MHWLKHMGRGLRQRIILIAVLPLTVITLMLGGYIIRSAISDAEHNLEARGESIVKYLAPACEFGVVTGNADMLEQIVKPVLTTTGVMAIRIRNADGELLLSVAKDQADGKRSPGDHGPKILSFASSIQSSAPPVLDYGDQQGISGGESAGGGSAAVGLIEIDISDEALRKDLHMVVINSLALIALGVLISALLGLLIGNSLARPLKGLTSTVERIAGGDWSAEAPSSDIRELDVLAAGINSMASTILEDRRELESRVKQATIDLRSAISELERRNEDLDVAMQEAERAGNAKSEFLARMSHEIRTPLNAIIGFARRLSKRLIDEDQIDAVRTIDTAATQLLTIIDDILTFVRAGETKDVMSSSSIDLREELDDILAIVASAAEEKRLELALLVDTIVPIEVTVDRIRFRQVIINLLNNAIKFTDEGEVTLRAKLEESDAGVHSLVVSVVDTGIGIAESKLSSIFEPFVGTYSTGQHLQGVGLGLAICDRLVKRMGGDLKAFNGPAGGAIFTVALPVDTPVIRQPGLVLAEMRIDVSDPNPRVQRALRNALMEAGANVRVRRREAASNGTVDVRMGPDLVIRGLTFDESLPAHESLWMDEMKRVACPMLLLGHYEISERLCGSESLSVLDKPVSREQLYRECLRLTGRMPVLAAASDLDSKDDGLPAALGLRALVAEDNEFSRLLLQTWLNEWGVEAIVVADGQAAVDRLLRERFDVALLDIRMPELDGRQVAKRARQELHGSCPYLIALTADVFFEPDDSAQLLFNEVLYKPINDDLLHRTLTGLVRDIAAEPPDSLSVPGEDGLRTLPGSYRSELIEALRSGMEAIRKDARTGDRQRLRDSVHSYKGIVGYFGLKDLAQAVSELESDLPNLDLAMLGARLDRIEALVRLDMGEPGD